LTGQGEEERNRWGDEVPLLSKASSVTKRVKKGRKDNWRVQQLPDFRKNRNRSEPANKECKRGEKGRGTANHA